LDESAATPIGGWTGIAQPFNIADAVEEVVVQTGNFGVEFGRSGGGILNVVTKSGTNSLHGTLLWRYQSQRFNSVSNVDKMNHVSRSGFNENVYGFTVGGPLRKDKTFFFGVFQQDTASGVRGMGQQTIISRLLKRGTTGGTPSGTRKSQVFEKQAQTVTTSDAANDHGMSGWFGVSPSPGVGLAHRLYPKHCLRFQHFVFWGGIPRR
jgi:hypothetical protein